MSIEPSWRVCPDEITPSHVCPTETAAHHAARLLAQGPGRDWRLRDLANLVHLSTSQLGRAFSQSFGMPPMRHPAQVRWRSRGHAARQFTAIIGVSPSAYRLTATQRASLKCPCCGQRSELPDDGHRALWPRPCQDRDP